MLESTHYVARMPVQRGEPSSYSTVLNHGSFYRTSLGDFVFTTYASAEQNDSPQASRVMLFLEPSAPTPASGLARASSRPSQPDQPHLRIFHLASFLPSSLFPLYTTGDRITTTHTTIQQMHIERNNANIFSFLGPNQMRTEINLQKLFRNYRSQIRVDAERRRGAP
jgi:hypothetical protein